MKVKMSSDIKSEDEMQEIRQLAEKQFPTIYDQKELEDLSLFFKSLGDETRLKILALLWMDDMCMCEIVSGLSAAPSTINHHLKIMEKGKIIRSKREGKFTIYSLNKDKLTYLMPILNEKSEV